MQSAIQLGPPGVRNRETSRIMLPAVLKFNASKGDANMKKLQQRLLDIFWGVKSIVDTLLKRGLRVEDAGANDVLNAVTTHIKLYGFV
jgi:hypothetical protein